MTGQKRTALRPRWAVAANQELIIGGLLLALVAVLALSLRGFASSDNLLNVVRNSSTLAILSIGAMLVVVARGLDLSVVSVMGVSSAFAVERIVSGHGELGALALGLAVALVLGAINGFLVAYVEIPPLFVTLASGLLFLGFFRWIYFEKEVQAVPDNAGLLDWLGGDNVAGVPASALLLAVVGLVVSWLMSRNVGRYLYAIGDNPDGARLTGLPVRPLVLLTYLGAACLGFVGGLNMVAIGGSYDLRTVATGTLLYDVIAVVVIGGVSLSGGRGTVVGVVCAALLLGVVENGMTLLDFNTIQQSLAKAAIVLLAIVLDSILHPRDEETARVGDL